MSAFGRKLARPAALSSSGIAAAGAIGVEADIGRHGDAGLAAAGHLQQAFRGGPIDLAVADARGGRRGAAAHAGGPHDAHCGRHRPSPRARRAGVSAPAIMQLDRIADPDGQRRRWRLAFPDDVEMVVEGGDLVDLGLGQAHVFGERAQMRRRQAAMCVLDQMQELDQQVAAARACARAAPAPRRSAPSSSGRPFGPRSRFRRSCNVHDLSRRPLDRLGARHVVPISSEAVSLQCHLRPRWSHNQPAARRPARRQSSGAKRAEPPSRSGRPGGCRARRLLEAVAGLADHVGNVDRRQRVAAVDLQLSPAAILPSACRVFSAGHGHFRPTRSSFWSPPCPRVAPGSGGVNWGQPARLRHLKQAERHRFVSHRARHEGSPRMRCRKLVELGQPTSIAARHSSSRSW